MTIHTYKLNEREAALIFKVVKSETSAYKNWIATAVQAGDFERAQKLVLELREYEALFACFNIEANKQIAEFSGKPIVTEHTPNAPRAR